MSGRYGTIDIEMASDVVNQQISQPVRNQYWKCRVVPTKLSKLCFESELS